MVEIFYNGRVMTVNSPEFTVNAYDDKFEPHLFYGRVERTITGDVMIQLVHDGENLQLVDGVELVSFICGTDLRERPSFEG